MTLDEAIKHAEEVADTCEYEASKYDMSDSYESHVACQNGKCAEEHRQLAEWLKDYKRLLDQQPSDTVSRGVFEQVMWERDIAIEQLHELGYEWGQKIEPCDDEITLKVKRGALKSRQGDMVIYNVAWLREHWQMEMVIVCGVKPCDEAISRQSVLDAIRRIGLCKCSTNEIQAVDECLRAVEALPPVKQKWIPVSERLPEKDDLYLINFADGEYELGYFSKDAFSYSGVIAWMPLPKPYEPQESVKINCKSTKCENCQNHNYCDYEPQESEE